MNAETKTLINIIKFLLHDGNIHSNTHCISLQFKEQNVDYEKLYQIAKQNSVANMVAAYILKCDSIPKEIKVKFQQHQYAIIAQQVQFEQVIKEVSDVLKEQKVKGIILKGLILKEFYPNPSMRSMSDIDAYAEKTDIEAIHKIMLQRGFQEGTIGRGNHYEYLKYRVAKIEFHPELVALNSAYGKKVYKKKVPISDAMQLWNHTEPFRGNEYLLQLTPEYHYVYVVMHMMNHFLTAGTGIRSVIDIWVMNRHYENTWNREEIDRILEKFNLAKFEKYARALADKWFSEDELAVDSVFENVADNNGIDHNITLDVFEDYIISCGTYGTMENSIASKINSEAFGRSKFRILLKSFFQPYDVMKRLYPVLKTAPALLPFIWIYRVVDIFKKREKYAKHKINVIMNADRKKVEELERLFKSMI